MKSTSEIYQEGFMEGMLGVGMVLGIICLIGYYSELINLVIETGRMR